MTARALPDDFPGRAALEAAGEATPAKVRKRIAAGTLQEIPNIGPTTEQQIVEAFEAFDSPDQQASEMKDSEDDGTKPSDHLDNAINKPAANTDSQSATSDAGAPQGTIVNDGTISDDTLQKAKEEGEKTGTQKNQELANHALDQRTGAEDAHNAVVASSGMRLARSGAVVVDDPRGQYVSKTAVRIGADEGRIKVLPINLTSPVVGMEIRDGDDVYALDDSFRRDSSPNDWLRVRSPNTGRNLID